MTVKNNSKKRRLTGKVVSDKMQDTLVVEVQRFITHPVYKKRMRKSKRYKAHYSGDTHKTGDVVEIEETRPLSREKRWKIVS